MVKEKITLSVEKDILNKFKEKAEKECWNISKKVEKFFEDELSNIKKAKSKGR